MGTNTAHVRPRPYDDGNMQPMASTLKNREVVILDSDVLKTFIDNDTTPGTSYICKAQVGTALDEPRWQIQRIVASGTANQTIEWADGDGKYDNVATNRVTLTYL